MNVKTTRRVIQTLRDDSVPMGVHGVGGVIACGVAGVCLHLSHGGALIRFVVFLKSCGVAELWGCRAVPPSFSHDYWFAVCM